MDNSNKWGFLRWWKRHIHVKSSPPLHIGFLPGSGVKKEYYDDFLNHLQEETHHKIETHYFKYFPFENADNNTILIGHSFGGFMCLIYSIRDIIRNERNIQSCILINSHFNEGNVMMYPGINMSLIIPPTLVILGTNDERLPYKKADDDYERATMRNITHIQFHITNGSHFSIFSNLNETDDAVSHILDFCRKNDIKI